MKEPATGGSPPPRRKTPPLARKSTPPREENILCGVPGTNPVRRLEGGTPSSLSIVAGSAHKNIDLPNQSGSMKETVRTPLQKPNRKNSKGGTIDDALSQMIGALQIVNDTRISGNGYAERKRRKKEASNAKKFSKGEVTSQTVSELGSRSETDEGTPSVPEADLLEDPTSIQAEPSLEDELRWMTIPTMDPGLNTRTWVEFLGFRWIMDPIRRLFGLHPLMTPMDAMDTNHQTCRYSGTSWWEPRSLSYAHRLGYRYTRRGQIYQNLLDHLFTTNVHTKVTTQRLQALSYSASTFLQTTYKNHVYDYDVMLNTVQSVAVKIRVYNLSLGSGVAAPDGEYAALTTQ